MDYILYALEQEQEQTAWELWCQLYPFMATGLIEHKSYNDFKHELFKPVVNYTVKDSQEIEDELLAVVSAYEGR